MRLDDAAEAELEELVARLDRLVPKEAAHVTIPSDPDGSATIGSRSGYLRLGVELLSAALRPLPDSGALPPRIEPRLEGLLTEGSRSPFQLCEIDESIASRPPVASRLGVLGQLGAGVLVVAAILVLFLAAGLVWRLVFG